MRLKDFCLSGLARILGTSYPTVAGSAGEGRYFKFQSRLREILRETFNDEMLGFHLTVFFTVILPGFIRAALESEGESNEEHVLIDELLKYNPGAYPHEFFVRIFERQFMKDIELTPPVLDLGIGKGDASDFIFSGRKLTIGSDPSIELLLAAKKRGQYETYAALDMTCLPFPDESFSTVTAFNSFYHVEDRNAAIKEIARVLTPGGLFVFNDALPEVFDMEPLSHFFDFLAFHKVKQDFEALLKGADGQSAPYVPYNYMQTQMHSLGLKEVEIVPFYSRPLAELGGLFMWLQHAFAIHSQEFLTFPAAEPLRIAWVKFLHATIPPFLKKDKVFCAEQDRSGFVMFKAKKQGLLKQKNIPSQFACPKCKNKLNNIESSLQCNTCSLTFPFIEGIPLLIPFYAEYYRDSTCL